MSNYLDLRNRNLKPFVWRADADLILKKFNRCVNVFLTQDTSKSFEKFGSELDHACQRPVESIARQ
jgi:hypothetical protein